MAADKIGVEDFGINTGALTDCAGRVGVVSPGCGDCGGTLFSEGGESDGRFPRFGFQGNEGLSKAGGNAQKSCVARVAKGMGELTKDLPVLPVGHVGCKKRVGHMIRLRPHRRVIIDTPLVLKLAGPEMRGINDSTETRGGWERD